MIYRVGIMGGIVGFQSLLSGLYECGKVDGMAQYVSDSSCSAEYIFGITL